jgi:hypothetical protein
VCLVVVIANKEEILMENEVGSNACTIMSRVTINVYAKGSFSSSLLSAYIDGSVWFVFWVCLPPFDNLLPSSTITFPKTMTIVLQ